MLPSSPIPQVSDIHTHNPQATDAVINLEPGMAMRPGGLYSAGWHPWWPDPNMAWVRRLAADPQVVMIGETGIDKRRAAMTLPQQIELAKEHARLAEEVGKPLILHIVGAWPEIMALRKELRPQQPWIIHGFRGKQQLAEQLVRAGFILSVNFAHTPPQGIEVLRESD